MVNNQALTKYSIVTKKRKKKLFKHPKIISLQEEISIIEEECLGLEEDLEDACAEYEAYNDSEVSDSLTQELPLRTLHDFTVFASGEKIESNLKLLQDRKKIRQQAEGYHRDLKQLHFDLHQKKIDLLLEKTKILLENL